ncbi:MAG: D-alanyl-D-alanine carboxypeptidase, partial [Eggerthellaceae bacterium]|nr:D-alanyl-D-alanine carboxypeptidase [Eggerthellaceae bacterium]
LKALLVPSGNDAAVAIAEAVGSRMIASDLSAGDDPMAAFVRAMNQKATELGCVDTLYENPHGLDDEDFEGNLHSTAADQALVARYAMANETFRAIVGGGSTTIEVDRDGGKAKIDLETTDTLLDDYKYAIGIKTGVTDLAGPSFMGAANNGALELYSVVLDSTDDWQRFQDTKVLFNWAYDHFLVLSLVHTTETASMNLQGSDVTVPVVGEAPLADWTDKTVKATFADANPVVTVFDLDGNVSQTIVFDELHGDVKAGQKVGTATYRQRNNVVATIDLVACEDVAGPNFFDALAVGWNRFVGGFNGTPERAESRVYNVMPVILNKVSNAA